MIIKTPNFVAIPPFFTAHFYGNILVINKKERIFGAKAATIFKSILEKVEKIQKRETTDALIYADNAIIISFGVIMRRLGRVIFLNGSPINVEDVDGFWNNVVEGLKNQSVYRVIPIADYIDTELSKVELVVNEDFNLLKKEYGKLKQQVSDLNATLTKLHSEIEAIKSELKELKGEEDKLDKEIMDMIERGISKESEQKEESKSERENKSANESKSVIEKGNTKVEKNGGNQQTQQK